MTSWFGPLQVAYIVLVGHGTDQIFFATREHHLIGIFELAMGFALAGIDIFICLRRLKINNR